MIKILDIVCNWVIYGYRTGKKQCCINILHMDFIKQEMNKDSVSFGIFSLIQFDLGLLCLKHNLAFLKYFDNNLFSTKHIFNSLNFFLKTFKAKSETKTICCITRYVFYVLLTCTKRTCTLRQDVTEYIKAR